MSRYFDFSDWTIEEICNHIRKRLADSKKPIPKKVMKHSVYIAYVCGNGCYTYSHNFYRYPECDECQTFEDAVNFLNKFSWLVCKGENMWVEVTEHKTYIDKDGNEIPYHYVIRESDYEEYEDGENYIEYTEAEVKALSESLYHIEKGLAYLRAYDYACEEYSFGEDRYVEIVKDYLGEFDKNYTEELPEDYEEDDDY